MKRQVAWQADDHWIVLILCMAASACLAVILRQDAGFDLLNYHYYSGFAFLHKPFGYDFAPAQIQTFHNPLMHVLSYLALANLKAKTAAALLGAIQGLNFYLVFRIAQVLFSGFGIASRKILALFCAAAGFYGIVSTTELGATYGDNLISIPVLAGLLLILRHLCSGRTSGKPAAVAFALSGLLMGAAFGLKFTSAMYALGVVAAVPLALLRTRNWARVTGAFVLGLTVGFLATYGFWAASLYSSFRNPVFPYLNRTFHSPFFEASNFLDERFLPRNWQQTLFYPFFFLRKNSLASEIGFRDIRLALCYVAILLIFGIALARLLKARCRQRDPCLSFLALFFLFSYVSWLHLSSIYRYLSVLELLAPVFLAYALSRCVKKKPAVVFVSMLLNAAIVAAAIPINFGRQEFDDQLLKLQIPKIADLDKSIVLMSGYEPTGYIVASFPQRTRFARISSTFMTPGRNASVDREIKRMLASYDRRHTFAFVPNQEEIGMARLDASAYDVRIDARSCFELRSGGRSRGYLCGLAGEPVDALQKPVPELGYFPTIVRESGVLLKARAGQKYIIGRFDGVKAASVDILYELDGEMMPAIRNWSLDSSGLLRLGPFGRGGTYRIIGIRNSSEPRPDLWIALDAEFRIH